MSLKGAPLVSRSAEDQRKARCGLDSGSLWARAYRFGVPADRDRVHKIKVPAMLRSLTLNTTQTKR